MGKRRKRGWRVVNFDRPMRKPKDLESPSRIDRKNVFSWLLDNVASQNNGKYLNEMSSRGSYFWIERDRESQDQSYFEVRVRGNNIVVKRQQWQVKGAGINTFLASFGLTDLEEDPVLFEEVILKHPLKEWASFKEAYASVAPTLGIWLD